MTPTQSQSTAVLLVDDDEDEFVLIGSYLTPSEDGRFELSWVRTFDLGLKALRDGRHDVYLIDNRLGAETGLRLLELLQAEGLRRPVIMLAGVGGGDLDRAALRAGAFDYLDKSSYSEAVLRRSIRYAAERGRIEHQLQWQAEILANVHDAVFLVDGNGVIQSWNAGAEQVFGLSSTKAIGSLASRLFPRITKFLSGKNPNGPDTLEFFGWCHRASGEKVALAVRLRFLNPLSGMPGRVIVCANDVSRQVRLEQQLSDAAEAEQRRIGQDIHDDLCQQLAGAGCFLKAIEQRLTENQRDQACALESLAGLIADANVRAREISSGLFPAVLKIEGLPVALHELAERTSRTFSLACIATCENIPPLPESVSTHLYRIAQEAVSNAARHAKPTRIDLTLATNESQITLVIRDNGQGIPGETRSSGMGLVTMAHRTRILGGDLDIHSAPRAGTEIRITVPLPLDETAPQ